MSESLQDLAQCQPTPGVGWFFQPRVNQLPITSLSVIVVHNAHLLFSGNGILMCVDVCLL